MQTDLFKIKGMPNVWLLSFTHRWTRISRDVQLLITTMLPSCAFVDYCINCSLVLLFFV